MIKPARKVYDAKKAEEEVRSYWKDHQVYEKVKQLRKDSPQWFFLDGPPYASGNIHLGTAWNKIIKDVILRYKTMCGLNVRRQPGWDCHGLPIEVKVEEELGIRSKKEIEERVGVKQFIQECKRWALEHVKIMTEQFGQLGVWMDWDNPYITMENDYMESAWWTLKRGYEKGLLKHELRVIPWCPRCETALAEHEIRGEYHDVSDPSIFVRFELRDHPREYLLVWTTTPWTLPANLAVCIHPDFRYARVETKGDTYILAEPLVKTVMEKLGISDYKVSEVVWGKSLEGLLYKHPLLEEVPKQEEFTSLHRVICGEHVSIEEGTGCVHTAPGHGEEDFEIGKKYNLPIFSPVDTDGKFTKEAGKYSGIFVKKADPLITQELKKKGVLVKEEKIVHSYPHCWRCGSPLIFRATPQWFLSVSSLKQDLLRKNSGKVKWIPEWVAARYSNGVESVGDWCISRQRYWGIPMPVWVCRQCNASEVIGSWEELKKFAISAPETKDLHRPYVDQIRLRCPACGGEMHRIPDVLDVWFDSGVASWASLGYPWRKEPFQKIWPSEFETEGEDQVTKWFYSQQVVSMIAFNDIPYKLALMHGFVLDEKGRKMSKSLGNIVEPKEVTDRYGVDAFRLYMLSTNPLWEDLKFSWKGVEINHRVLTILWNVHVFATTYMSLDGFNPKKVDQEWIFTHLQPEDRWMLSRVNTLIKDVTSALDQFNLHVAARILSSFILEDLSRWYIRLVRERVWIERDDPRKLAAYVTLYQALHVLCRLLAPFVPNISEAIYRDLVRGADERAPESVHMLPWPHLDERVINKKLEDGMSLVRKFVDVGAAARQDAKLKLRWPVNEIRIKPASSDEKALLGGLEQILKHGLNCKTLTILNPEDQLVQASEPSERFSVTSTDAGELAVDTLLTPELRAECLARELIRRLQMMRNELNLKMEEKVDVAIGTASSESLKQLESQRELLCKEVRILNLDLCSTDDVRGEGHLGEWDIEGTRFKLLMRKQT